MVEVAGSSPVVPTSFFLSGFVRLKNQKINIGGFWTLWTPVFLQSVHKRPNFPKTSRKTTDYPAPPETPQTQASSELQRKMQAG